MSTVPAAINRYGILGGQWIPPEARPEFGATFDDHEATLSEAVDQINAKISEVRSSPQLTPSGKTATAKQIIEEGDRTIEAVGGKKMAFLLQELRKAEANLPGPLARPDPAAAVEQAEIRTRLNAMPAIEREAFARGAAKAGLVSVIQAIVHDPLQVTLPVHIHDALKSSLQAG